jgi:hypothetical protein
VLDYTHALELNPRDALTFSNRAAAYFVLKDYDSAWDDVHRGEVLGVKFDPAFLQALKQASGRER